MRTRRWCFKSVLYAFSSILLTLSAVDITYSDTVTVSGIVIDEQSGQPVSGAKVELTNANAGTGYFIGYTGADGRFSFAKVRTGLPYDLAVLADGYCPHEMQSWSLPENQSQVDLKLPLIRASVIKGRVTKSDGETPLQNVKVELNYRTGNFQMLDMNMSLFTDGDGQFTFGQLPPNVYDLSFSLGGYISERVTGARPPAGGEKTYAIKLYQPASISGFVTLSDDGNPLSDIEIAGRGASQQTGTTDANGFFSIGELRPGSYKLQSHPSGFNAYETPGVIQLTEGENVQDVSIALTPLPPALSVNLNREVFLPDQDLIFQIRTFRIGQYRCAVHSLPITVFTQTEFDIEDLIEDIDLSPFATALDWTEEVDFSNPYVWIDRDVKAPEHLKPGAYILRIYSPSDNVEDRILFFVTELGIVVKRGEKTTFVYATDLRTSMPVPDVQLKIQSRPEERKQNPGWTETLTLASNHPIQWTGKTDEHGIYTCEQALETTAGDVIAYSPDGFLAVSSLVNSGIQAAIQQNVFVYTDRPLYRPGHTVYYKSIFRDEMENGHTITPGKTITVRVFNSNDEEFYSTELKTNEWGSIDGSFEIPQDAPLGNFRIQTEDGNKQGASIHFYVEEYRKPEYKVEIKSDRPSYINGDLIKFIVRAEYYFGAPVPNADVNYRFYETVSSGGGNRFFPSSYTSYLSYGQCKTDAEGMAPIEFTPKRSSKDRKITIEVDIVEASGRQVSGQASVPVGVGLFYITAQPTRHVFDRETPMAIEIRTRHHDDSPASAVLEVEFTQEVWNPVRRSYVRPTRPQANRPITTDAEGKAILEWLPDTDISGRLEVILTGKDERGNRITASTSVWRMAYNAGSFDIRYPTLEGILDKDSYKPGEAATLLINTQYPENPVVLTIESRDIHSYRVIWPSGKTTQVKIPILESYAPNVYISLFMPRGINLSTRVLNLYVPEDKGNMIVEVEAGQQKYKPGDTGTATIRTSLLDGKPIPAEVSLAVVDEAIFALRHDHTPDIHQAFYSRRSNWVNTNYSFPLNYYGGANKGVNLDIRKDFRDTAAWFANVYTDENGQATVDFKFPDNLTTWRLTARGHTKNTEVGWTKSTTQVSKDIVARLSLPRFFIEGDSLKLPTLINNLSGENLPEIKMELDVSGGMELKEAKEKSTQAAAGAVARELWDITATASEPSTTMIFKAWTPNDGDALQLSAPVLPLGFREEKIISGKIGETTTAIELNLDETIRLQDSKVQLNLTPSVAAVALGAMPYLTDFPYGCVEQTLNGYLPSILLIRTLNDLELMTPEDAARMGDLDTKVQESLSRIYSMQIDNGAWGWFRNGNSDDMLSALVVHGLHLTQQLGYPIDQDRLNTGVNYLSQAVQERRDWDTTAYMAYVMSECGRREQYLVDELYANMNELYDFGLATGALALHNFGMDDKARELLERLKSNLVDLPGGQAAWEVSPELFWRWNGTSIETTAWGLIALAKLDGLSPATDKITQWLIAQRRGSRWRSTRDTALVIQALSQVMKTEAREGQLDELRYAVELNGQLLEEKALSKTDLTKPVSINLSAVHGSNEIRLLLDRPVGYWSLDESLFHQGESNQASPHDLFKFNRLYERAIHTKDYRGRPKILSEGFAPDDKLDIGDEILITLIVDSKRELPYAIVEDPLPSGCEVVESFIHSNQWGWNPYSHYERRDQKMVFFLENIPKGETRIEYLIRTELSGIFRANPARAWCMYYPEISARSASNRITVSE